MTVRALYQDTKMTHPVAVAVQDFSKLLRRRKGCLWVDISGQDPMALDPVLRDTFGFHPLAIEDALQQTHVPKIDNWEDYLLIVLHSVQATPGNEIKSTLEMDVFIGAHYLVSYHALPSSAIERVWKLAEQSRTLLSKGTAGLLYRIIDEVEADFTPLFDSIDEQIDRIEDQIFERPSQALLAEIFRLKRSILGLRRILAPQREVLGKLARGSYELFTLEDRMYFHDVYDHMVQLGEILENLRDIINGALEIYLSAVSNRLNDILKTLTVITTLFMPLTFIVGFFGMNFFTASEMFSGWTGRVGFSIALLLMVFTPLALYGFIRRRAWT